MLRADFAKLPKVIENGTIRKLGYVTVSYSHFIATTAVSVAVLTQYTNVTDRQADGQTDRMTA